MSDIDTNANPSDPQVPGTDTPAAATTPPAGSAPATTGETPADTSQQPDKGKPDAGFQKAINRVTRQRGEAERRAIREAARADAAEALLRSQGQQPTPAKGAELRQEDFPNYDAYAKAIARQEARAAAKEEIEADNKARSETEATQAARRQHERFLREAAKQGEASGIDFEEHWATLQEASFVSPAVASFVYESENPAALVEFLAENPDELDRVSRLTPAAAFRALVKTEAGLKPAKSRPNATGAPPPVPTVGGRAVHQADWRKSDNMDEYGAQWQRERAAKTD